MNTANDRREAIATLRDAGVDWAKSEDIASRFDIAAIRQQVEWLPLRPDVRDPSSFLVSAIERSFPAPTMETAAVARGVDYAAQLGAGYRLTTDQQKYYDAASQLHDQVVAALDELTDGERARHMDIATRMTLERWPNLRRSSKSFPIALDRALAERLNISVGGVPSRLIQPRPPFDDVDHRDPNRAIALSPAPAPVPKKLGQLIPLTPRVVHNSGDSAQQMDGSAHNSGPSVHEIDLPVHEPIADSVADLPAFEDEEAPV